MGCPFSRSLNSLSDEMDMVRDRDLLRLVVEKSRQGLQLRPKALRVRDGVRNLAEDGAWGRITPHDRLGPVWEPAMLGVAVKKWRAEGPEGVWWPVDEPGVGRKELTTRPEYAHNLFGDDRDTGRQRLVNTKVREAWSMIYDI